MTAPAQAQEAQHNVAVLQASLISVVRYEGMFHQCLILFAEVEGVSQSSAPQMVIFFTIVA
jgi:hypothetical protein